MADVTPTASAVLAGGGTDQVWGIAGEALTQGQTVYQSAADDRWYKGDNNDTAAKAAVKGVVLTASGTGQRVKVQKSGPVTLGTAVLTAGTTYYQSATAGAICPYADLAQGHYITIIGVATTANVLAININATGVQVP